jgi:hypothetical protein
MGKMVRNLVTVKDEGKGADMKRYVSPARVWIQPHVEMILMDSLYRRYSIKSTCRLYPSLLDLHCGSTTMPFACIPCRRP